MVGPRLVGEGEKVRGECVVAAANEALRAREHCRCAQVDLHRGDGGPLGSVMRKASWLTVLAQAVVRAWPVRRKWNQILHSIADDRTGCARGSTICLRYRRLVAAFVQEPTCTTGDSLADLTSGGRSRVVAAMRSRRIVGRSGEDGVSFLEDGVSSRFWVPHRRRRPSFFHRSSHFGPEITKTCLTSGSSFGDETPRKHQGAA